MRAQTKTIQGPEPLYTPSQRKRRDETVWTLVQGVLAPLQFLVFLISLALVVRYLVTGLGYEIAALSIVIKTIVLLAIMVTGAIWEKVVFGQYLLAASILLGRCRKLFRYRAAFGLCLGIVRKLPFRATTYAARAGCICSLFDQCSTVCMEAKSRSIANSYGG